MKKTLLVSALAGLFVAACGGSGGQQAQQAADSGASAAAQQAAPAATGNLNIYNWSDYVDPATVAEFEKTNNIKVRYDYYDSNETLEAKVLTGKSGYDLVAPSIANVGRQIQAGAYQEIDKSLISNYNNIDPELLKMMDQVDPGNKYAVPYFWGINTLAINKDQVAKALGSDALPANEWDLVFNPEYTAKLKQCGISYLDSAAEVYPMVLNYMGKNPNSSNIDDIKAASELLKQNRPNIKRFTSSGFIDDLARGDTCVTIGFGGDLNIAKRRAEEAGGKEKIQVMMPKEGVGIWIDSFAIPKDAANVLNAHRYIDNILEPEVAAQNGDYVTYAPSSLPARALMAAEYRDDNTVFPTDEDMANSFIMVPIEPESLKFMVRQWQSIKAGK